MLRPHRSFARRSSSLDEAWADNPSKPKVPASCELEPGSSHIPARDPHSFRWRLAGSCHPLVLRGTGVMLRAARFFEVDQMMVRRVEPVFPSSCLTDALLALRHALALRRVAADAPSA